MQKNNCDGYFVDENGIVCLGSYHPRRGGANPRFDEFSESILCLKDGPTAAKYAETLDNFALSVREELAAAHPQVWRSLAVAVVPSHDPERIDSGIRTLAQSIADEDRMDATGSLVRQKKVRKQATGGTRDIDHHLQSIQVENSALPSGRIVLVIDDVTTTGNSLLACRKLLTSAGVRSVILCSLSKTVRYGS